MNLLVLYKICGKDRGLPSNPFVFEESMVSLHCYVGPFKILPVKGSFEGQLTFNMLLVSNEVLEFQQISSPRLI